MLVIEVCILKAVVTVEVVVGVCGVVGAGSNYGGKLCYIMTQFFFLHAVSGRCCVFRVYRKQRQLITTVVMLGTIFVVTEGCTSLLLLRCSAVLLVASLFLVKS